MSQPARSTAKRVCSCLAAIEQVNRELGTTTALITHNRSISGMADRVHRFSDGQIVESTLNEARVPVEELEW